MGKIALGILTSVLIVAASACLGVFLIEKVRREMEFRAPTIAGSVPHRPHL
jgi:UPF0716 family protein affecting phage T7 exclusion